MYIRSCRQQNNRSSVRVTPAANASLATFKTTPTPMLTAATTTRRITARQQLKRINPVNSVRRPSLAFAIVVAALVCCLTSYTCINQIQASSPSSSLASSSSSNVDEIAESLAPSASHSDSNKQLEGNPHDRLDLVSLSSNSDFRQSNESGSSSQSSIVASLSSAVASAAAAAAVAAAQNSLTSSDARSLLSAAHHGSSLSTSSSSGAARIHHAHHQAARSPGLHLALKIADAIPEVPYHILHNMKKLDHAAPFYNVAGSKMIGGNSKESNPSLLSSALSNMGGLEHLSALFRSPIWKRIADGYGEFTSEFRSLFRAPPTTMKGPTSSTTKMLRDISVPALLMLLATTMPSDWRPMRTRRKSQLVPVGLTAQAISADPMLASASGVAPGEFQGFSLTSQPQTPLFRQTNFNQLLGQQQQTDAQVVPDIATTSGLNPLAQLYNLAEQQQQNAGQLARVGSDIQQQQGQADAGQNSLASAANSWLQPASRSTNGQNYFGPGPQASEQSIRRMGLDSSDGLTAGLPTIAGEVVASEMANRNLDKLQLIQDSSLLQTTKPVKGNGNHLQFSSSSSSPSRNVVAWQPQPTGLLSSLTSALVGHEGKLTNRIINANGDRGAAAAPQSQERKRVTLMRKEHLNEKHRYSLVGDSDNENDSSQNFGSITGGERQRASSQKSSFLSTMSQAIAGVFNPTAMATNFLESGSKATNSLFTQGRQMFAPIGNGNSNIENHSIGDKAINQEEFSLMRHLQQKTPAAAGDLAEQRDLTLLLPQSWRGAVKRTMSNVQQQATSQWKSIEGQLTNWVQDKLKTFPASMATQSTVATAVPAAAASGSNSAQGSPLPPVANLLASVGSTAMNILGLGNSKSAAVGQLASSAGGSPASTNESSPPSSANAGYPSKAISDSPAKETHMSPKKGALAGMANVIVSTLTNRQNLSTTSTGGNTTGNLKAPISEVASTSGNYPTSNGAASASSPLTSSAPLTSSSSTTAGATSLSAV